jgi:hypothetical protein
MNSETIQKSRIEKIMSSNLIAFCLASGVALTSCALFVHGVKMCDMEEEKNIQRAKDYLAEFNRDTGKDYQIVGSNGQYIAIIPFTPIPLQGAASPFMDKAEMIEKTFSRASKLRSFIQGFAGRWLCDDQIGFYRKGSYGYP